MIRRLTHLTLAGALVPSAFSQSTAERIEASFRGFDRDGDGALTREESGNANWFNLADENRDGKVTLDEAVRRLSAVVERHGIPPREAAPPAEEDSLKEAPKIRKASELGVGRRVPQIPLRDLAGREVAVNPEARALVIACFGPSCPLSHKFGPELARLEKEFGKLNVDFIFLNPVTGSKVDAARTFAATHGLTSPVVHDAADGLASRLRAETTTEVFVLDAARTLVFRGAVSDQYGLGYSREAPTRTYLRDALDAVLRGGSPAVAATTAPGCALDLPSATTASPTDAPTYHREISRLVQTHCIECHRDGGLGPFSLESYDDLIEHAAMIRRQVERGAMPPWFAVPSSTSGHSLFSNDRSLPESDKAALLAWLKSDRPAGDPADAPLARTFPKGWSLATPDAVFQIPKAVDIKAEGIMPYQNLVVETSFAEDRWVQGYEILPTAAEVVHHVIVTVHPKDGPINRRGEHGFFAAYVPGNSSRMLPDGFAKRLPAGARLNFQIHYTPNGRATSDQMKIGLVFATSPPRNEVHVVAVAQPRINIPPGAAHHVEVKRQPVPANMNFTAFMAHMHVRGKSFRFDLTTPDGKTETLLDLPRYDFNWQLQYNYAQPRFVPRGSTLTITAVFDNSEGNPANPDPTKTVRWGEQTHDEMMIGYIEHHTPLP